MEPRGFARRREGDLGDARDREQGPVGDRQRGFRIGALCSVSPEVRPSGDGAGLAERGLGVFVRATATSPSISSERTPLQPERSEQACGPTPPACSVPAPMSTPSFCAPSRVRFLTGSAERRLWVRQVAGSTGPLRVPSSLFCGCVAGATLVEAARGPSSRYIDGRGTRSSWRAPASTGWPTKTRFTPTATRSVCSSSTISPCWSEQTRLDVLEIGTVAAERFELIVHAVPVRQKFSR